MPIVVNGHEWERDEARTLRARDVRFYRCTRCKHSTRIAMRSREPEEVKLAKASALPCPGPEPADLPSVLAVPGRWEFKPEECDDEFLLGFITGRFDSLNDGNDLLVKTERTAARAELQRRGTPIPEGRPCAICGVQPATHPITTLTPEQQAANKAWAESFKDADGNPVYHTGHCPYLELPTYACDGCYVVPAHASTE